eukprot:gnl/TRDRNA2_/TRDRNA2_37545_c0_seq1.p1 gnl/TRDRNA2_/TRDRNA2_37545_c0~~gnl/TRDRNA2_/TRDRNA2_37545_c0_seq1.p1  ORF type:complete len:416 (-),score=140.20 gnl/TRDRNA2_/TRDRNA2_37545_c0_seq1:318-1505(-)
MVAKKQGVKRAAASEHQSAPAPKRPAAQKRTLDSIISTLNGATIFPQATRDLLVSMVYGGLGCPKDERHKYQTMAVDMIGESLDSIRAAMQKAVDAENEKVATIEASKSDLDLVRTQAEELLAQKAAASANIKEQLVQDSTKLSQARKVLAECQEAQKKGDKEHVANQQEASEFETAFEQNFKSLKAGTFESDTQAKQLLSTLQSLVAKMDMEESMAMSLPTACIKKPEDRGTFDNMIFDEFEKVIVAKIADLHAKIAQGAPAAAQRSEAVAAAEAAVEEAKATVQTTATSLSAASAEEKEQSDALKAAEKAVKDFTPNFKKATQVRDELVLELEVYDEVQIAGFNKLKEFVEKKEEEPMQCDEQAANAEVTPEAPVKEIPEKTLAPEVVGAVGA